MSSWVAPAVAAELWKCSLEQVLAGVRDGQIPSRVEGQFLMVHVSFPEMVTNPPPQPRAQYRPISEAVESSRASEAARVNEAILTPQEVAALTAEPISESEPVEAAGFRSDRFGPEKNEEESSGEHSEPDSSEPPLPDEDDPSSSRHDVAQWRMIRRQTSNLRKPPNMPDSPDSQSPAHW